MGSSNGCMLGNPDVQQIEKDPYFPPSATVIPHIFKNRYRMTNDKDLGKGSYATVKLAADKQTGELVAVKVVRREELLEVDDKALHLEAELMRSLNHQNIVRCIDFFSEDKFYYVVLEYMPGGELFQRIMAKEHYSEKDARDVVKSVLNGIKYCHDKGIVHRDLKPENLLLKSPDNDHELKIADFGFASTNGDFMKTQLGTPAYIAPEILGGKAYDKAVDMWSIGVITYITLGGYPPFQDNNLRALFKKIRNGTYTFHPENWSAVSDEAKDFIRGLLCVQPDKRLTAEQALEHAWLQVDDESLSQRSLDSNLPSFRDFAAKRRFRKIVLSVMAINKMQRLVKANDSGRKSDETSSAEAVPTTSTIYEGNTTVPQPMKGSARFFSMGKK